MAYKGKDFHSYTHARARARRAYTFVFKRYVCFLLRSKFAEARSVHGHVFVP